MNPYFGKTFFEFVFLFCTRVVSLTSPLASDEIQLITLLLCGIAAALVGSFLVVRNMTMLANSLSHTMLLGIVSVVLLVGATSLDTLSLHALLCASLFTGLITTVSTEFLQKVMRIQRDASIGLVFSGFFSLGIVLVFLFTRNSHIGVEAIAGNIDGVGIRDMQLLVLVDFFLIVSTILFFNRLKVVSFDPLFAAGKGISVRVVTYAMMICSAASAIASFHAVGIFLFLSLLVTLPQTARLFVHTLKEVILLSCGLAIFYAFVGAALSRHILSVYDLPLSTSGLTVLLSGTFFLIGTRMKTSLISRQAKEYSTAQ